MTFTADDAIRFFRIHTSDIEEFEWRLKQNYDGIMGVLPEWMTDDQKKEFLTAREKVVKSHERYGYELSDVYNLVENWFEHLLKDTPRQQLPDTLANEIRALSQLKYYVFLGAEEALKRTLGDDAERAVSSITARNRGKKGGQRKRYDLVLQELIDECYREAIKTNGTPTLTDVISQVDSCLDEDGCFDSDLDDVYRDGDSICWKNRKGDQKSIKNQNFYPYLNRAKIKYSA